MSSPPRKPTGRPEPPQQRAAARPPRPPRRDSAGRPPMPILWGAGLGGLVFVIVAVAVFVSVRLSKQIAVSRSDTSPTPATATQTPPGHEEPTAPAEERPSGVLPGQRPGLPAAEAWPPGPWSPMPRPPVREPVPSERVTQGPAPAPNTEPAPGTGGSEGDGRALPEEAPQDTPDQTVAEAGMPGGPGGQRPGNAEPPAEPDQRPPAAPPEEPPPPAESGPLDDIRARDRFLVLPPLGAPGGAGEPVELAKVLVDTPSECTLSVLGSDIVLGDGLSFVLECEDAEDGTRTWHVLLDAEARLGGAGQIGTFELRNRSLMFAWESTSSLSSKAARLRYCLLSVAAGGQSERCFLSEPERIEPPKIEFSKRASRVPIAFDVGSLPRVENLRLDLQPEGLPRHEIDPPTGWKPGETGTIRVFKLGPAGRRSEQLAEVGEETEPARQMANGSEPLMEIEVEFEFGDKRSDRRGLCYRAFADAKTLEPDGSFEDKRTLISSDRLGSWQKALSHDKRTMLSREKRLEKDVAQAQRAQLNRPVTPADQLEQARMQSVLALMSSEIRKTQQAIRLFEAAEEKGNELKKLFESLEADGRLGFRIYVEIDGEQVEILRTKLESAGT